MVEILVVMAIVSILAALLLPVVNRSVMVARTLTCLNNQRQHAVAQDLFIADNNGRLVTGIFWYRGTGPKLNWFLGLYPYMAPDAGYDIGIAGNYGGNYSYWIVPLGSVYHCPGEKWGVRRGQSWNSYKLPAYNLPIPLPKGATDGYSASIRFVGTCYGMNVYLDSPEYLGRTESATTNQQGSEIPAPPVTRLARYASKMFMFSERYNDGFTHAPISANWTDSASYLNFERHDRALPVAHLDGHGKIYQFGISALNKYGNSNAHYFSHWGYTWWSGGWLQPNDW